MESPKNQAIDQPSSREHPHEIKVAELVSLPTWIKFDTLQDI
jgi:hypothetical protein